MGIHLFCGNPRVDEHEWNQVVEICQIINQHFDKTKPIFLLYNFNLSTTCQIDLMIIQEKGISILELKSYKGEIIGNENKNDKWSVKTETCEVELPVNVFVQLLKEGNSLRKKLERIRKDSFPNINERNIKKIDCWGYFEKGSSFDINQIPPQYHKWFDVITGDDLIRKLSFVNTGYKLDKKDMLEIKNNLNVSSCPEDDPRLSFLFIEKLEDNWLPKIESISKEYLAEVKTGLLEMGELDSNQDWIINLKARIFEDGKLSKKSNSTKSIDEILKLSNYSIITGVAGSGKTTFLHQVYEKVLSNKTQYKTPIYISLREIQQYKIDDHFYLTYKKNDLPLPSEKDFDDKFSLEISKLIIYSYFQSLAVDEDLIKRKEVFLVLFEKLLQDNQFVFCLDGYDEISKGKKLVDNWLGFLSRNNIPFILTTRPIDLVRLEKILGINGLHYYWLLFPNKEEITKYLESRANKLGIKLPNVKYENFTPMQLSIRSQFPIKLDLNENQEFEFLIYGQVLWEAFKNNSSIISRITSMDDITRLLKSEKAERNGKEYSMYDFLNGPLKCLYTKDDNRYDASIKSVCGELAYLSYLGGIDSEYIVKLYKENPFNSLFVDIVTLPDVTKSVSYFIRPQLRDYFALQYIYSQYTNGKIVSLINSDVMKLFHNLLKSKKPWETKNDLTKYGTNSNEIIMKYLVTHPIRLKPTELVTESIVMDHLLIMSRFRMGVPEWYENLIQGIVSEIINERDTIRNERLSSGLLSILERIPERTLNTAYDSIINDIDFDGHSESVSPYQYKKQIREIFPEFDAPLVSHIQDLFNELNRLSENNYCKACDVEKLIKEYDEKIKSYSLSENDLDAEENDDLNSLIDVKYTHYLTHEIDEKSSLTYVLNLLESTIDGRIKNWAIMANEIYSLYSLEGLLRHRADFSNDDYLQYFASRLIGVAKTKHLALYANSIWYNLLRGMATDGGGFIPGPEMIYEYGFDAIDSLLKKEVIWEGLVGDLFTKVIHSDDNARIGNLLFNNIRKHVSYELFKQLTTNLISILTPFRGGNSNEQRDCLKGFEDVWMPILLDSGVEGLYLISYLELEDFDFTKEQLEKIFQEVKVLVRIKHSLEVNPQLLEYLMKKEFPITWTDFLYLLGIKMKSDSFFRELVSNVSEDTLLNTLNNLDTTKDKLLAAIISRKNLDYLRDFLSVYLVGINSIDNETLYQNWLKQYFSDNKEPFGKHQLVQYAKLWVLSEIMKYDLIDEIFSNNMLDFKKLTEFFKDSYTFYGRELVENLPINEFWDRNISERIIKNILTIMIESLEYEHRPSHDYYIKTLFPYLDAYPSLNDMVYSYIAKLVSTEFGYADSNYLLLYYKENPHSKFKKMFLKTVKSIDSKQEIQNILVIAKYQLSNLENKGIFEKKVLDKQTKLLLEYIGEIIDILIDKDLELLENSIYNEMDNSNFDLLDLAVKTNNSKINEYIMKILQYAIPFYHVDILLDVIEEHCDINKLKKELRKIKKNLLEELKELKDEKRKWRIDKLEKTIERCTSLIEQIEL